jgi:hypothetical protein
MEIKSWKDRGRIAASFTISTTALVLAALYVFRPAAIEGLRLDKKTVGFLVVAALPWIMSQIESFKGFGFEFKRRLREQGAVIQQQQELLNLMVMFWYSMEADMFDTLKNLVEHDPFTHNPRDSIHYPTVNAQLKELYNRGYVERDPDTIQQDENIGGGRIVTPLGKRFVYQRLKLEAEGAMQKLQAIPPLAPTVTALNE